MEQNQQNDYLMTEISKKFFPPKNDEPNVEHCREFLDRWVMHEKNLVKTEEDKLAEREKEMKQQESERRKEFEETVEILKTKISALKERKTELETEKHSVEQQINDARILIRQKPNGEQEFMNFIRGIKTRGEESPETSSRDSSQPGSADSPGERERAYVQYLRYHDPQEYVKYLDAKFMSPTTPEYHDYSPDKRFYEYQGTPELERELREQGFFNQESSNEHLQNESFDGSYHIQSPSSENENYQELLKYLEALKLSTTPEHYDYSPDKRLYEYQGTPELERELREQGFFNQESSNEHSQNESLDGSHHKSFTLQSPSNEKESYSVDVDVQPRPQDDSDPDAPAVFDIIIKTSPTGSPPS